MRGNPLSSLAMLATSMHAQPGVYAVLLGSGVSTSAGVPTGWGVVRDLVRKVAAANTPGDMDSQRVAEDDPATWWAQHGDGDLGYAALLQALAPTPAVRQGLLAEYFEPTEEERAAGSKVPSKAHMAVAELVKRGYVRVVLTTNFDRLTEQALEAMGVSPQVIARPEAVNGMAPLAHAAATVVKLHGDYKDLGTRNTPEELSEYPAAWTTLLSQVFDEYGLLVCGWSADWDTTLVAALESAPNRRYPLYWDSRSSKGDTAQRLLRNRSGLEIPSPGADELLTDLVASVDALERLAQPPLTTAMAIARLKKYLPDPVRRIDLHDLLMGAANEVRLSIEGQPTSLNGLDGEKIEEIYDGHLAAVQPLAEMAITGVWHDQEGAHDDLWIDALQRLVEAGTAPLSNATTGLDRARLWPALLLMTAIGVTAVRRDRERVLLRITTEVQGRADLGTGPAEPASQLLHPNRLMEHNWINAMPRWGQTNWQYPASHILQADIRPMFDDLIPAEADFKEAFFGYEYRLGLIQEHASAHRRGYRALSGEYVGSNAWSWDESDTPLAELAFRAAAKRNRDWPWIEFLGSDDIDAILVAHRDTLKRYRQY